MISIQKAFKGLYRLCGCGCKYLIKIINKKGKIIKYKKGHFLRTINQTGFNNINWKFGRSKIEDYWFIRINNEYLREHVYFYEQKNKLCMLPWGDVHHQDENKENNMPWNLQGMMRSQHQTMHHIDPDMEDRFCSKYGSHETALRETKMGPRPNWYGNEQDGFECKKCYLKKYSKKHYKRKKLHINFV